MKNGTASAGKDRGCNKFLHTSSFHVCQIHRQTGEVPVPAFCQFHLEKQHSGDYGAAQTDEKYFNDILQFANDIRMIGLPVRKEKAVIC